MASSPTRGTVSPGNSTPSGRARAGTATSVAQSVRSATEKVLNTDLPPGFLAATADATAQAPSIGEIRSGSADGRRSSRDRTYSNRRWSARLSRGSQDSERHGQQPSGGLEPFPALAEEITNVEVVESKPADLLGKTAQYPLREKDAHGPRIAEHESADEPTISKKRQRVYTNGYVPPPKIPWKTSTANALRGFWKWFLTPFGFLVTIYGLNVVAWGGMLFLLLCGAAPEMCWANDPIKGWVYDCNNIHSARRIWIETDSQILNALFCVTGFGLIPWRFRDLYYIMAYHLTNEKKHGLAKKMQPLRRLAGHYRNWFRLPGSDTLDTPLPPKHAAPIDAAITSAELEDGNGEVSDLRVPLPTSKRPIDPPTGHRAPPTALWKVDFFVWCQVWNTLFQVCLCFFMWHYNRIDRPSWSTGLFVALACGIVGVGGIVSYIEGRRVKKVEGILPSAAQLAAMGVDRDTDLDSAQTSSGRVSGTPEDRDRKEAEVNV